MRLPIGIYLFVSVFCRRFAFFDFYVLIGWTDHKELGTRCAATPLANTDDVGALRLPTFRSLITIPLPDSPNIIDSLASFFDLVAYRTDVIGLPHAGSRRVFSVCIHILV